MPEPTHPPYESGALTTPRQLYRWLDVNAQNGRLNRTQTYIAVPPFNVATSWLGYSQIVAEYHYEAPNNFSLKVSALADVIPSGTNYTLCVSYVNKDNSVVRYSLIRGAGDLFYAELTPYAGQLIKKNFRIEVWDTNSAAASETLTTLIYTSVLGHRDYRYDIDGPLVGNDPVCEGQQSTLGNGTITPPDYFIAAWLDAGYSLPLVTPASWVDRKNSLNFVGNNDNFALLAPNIGQLISGQTFIYNTLDSPKQFFFHFSFNAGANNNIIFQITNAGDFFVSVQPVAGTISIAVLGVITNVIGGLVGGKEYIAVFSTSVAAGTSLSVYEAGGLGLLDTTVNASGLDLGIVVTQVGTSNANGFVLKTRGVLIYSAVLPSDIFNAALGYMGSLSSDAQTMLLPLTWGLCAQPTLNK